MHNFNVTNRSNKRSIDLTNSNNSNNVCKKEANGVKNKTASKKDATFNNGEVPSGLSKDNSLTRTLPALTGSFVNSTKNARSKMQRTNSSFIVLSNEVLATNVKS